MVYAAVTVLGLATDPPCACCAGTVAVATTVLGLAPAPALTCWAGMVAVALTVVAVIAALNSLVMLLGCTTVAAAVTMLALTLAEESVATDACGTVAVASTIFG